LAVEKVYNAQVSCTLVWFELAGTLQTYEERMLETVILARRGRPCMSERRGFITAFRRLTGPLLVLEKEKKRSKDA
jgi:hypothetical protein